MGFLWAVDAGFRSALFLAQSLAYTYFLVCLVIRFWRWADNLNAAKGRWRVD